MFAAYPHHERGCLNFAGFAKLGAADPTSPIRIIPRFARHR